jgi:hypothetical protein
VAPPPEPTIEDFDALSPAPSRMPAFEEEMTDPHLAPPNVYDDVTPVPGSQSDEEQRPLEEAFQEAPTLARIPPPTAPAPPAQQAQSPWGKVATTLSSPIARIPRARLVTAALAALATVAALIYYYFS